jgi:hypothetical protein
MSCKTQIRTNLSAPLPSPCDRVDNARHLHTICRPTVHVRVHLHKAEDKNNETYILFKANLFRCLRVQFALTSHSFKGFINFLPIIDNINKRPLRFQTFAIIKHACPIIILPERKIY